MSLFQLRPLSRYPLNEEALSVPGSFLAGPLAAAPSSRLPAFEEVPVNIHLSGGRLPVALRFSILR